ncbi:hypothetical protein [Mycobacterium aquaticum]|uniref:hypothetical protein n=1 Tax=Mycobacterium aquaticum TaxID=1927124 RepID=UPI00115472E5|nr:hypothetical protein [Mycobacterium aquaticum]
MVDWAPYGGPDEEDTLPRFGMDVHRLKARFVELVTELTRHSGTVLTERQRHLLTRARELVPSMSCRPASSTARAHRSGNNTPTTLGLSPADGQWTMRHGLWFWKQKAQQQESAGRPTTPPSSI